MEAEVAWHYLLRLVDSLAVEQYLTSSVVRLVLNMTDQSLQRRLAAIVVADVVGYSRLMEADEVATLADLRKLRSGVIEPAAVRYKGRIFKVMGDGFLIEFGSAVDAVAAALEMQRATTLVEASADRRLLLRVGVNLGDVIDDGSDVLGDGVNVAARLETLAAPGGICISAKVHGEIVGKIGDRFFDAGERYLKNLARPVHVWHWPDALQRILPLPECPSIAVLPFTNTSGDEADAPFVDGLTEDLITDLSRTAGLFVIARNSVYGYKGKPVDVRLVAQDLGVRYVLEGSARRAMGRVRINAQLIDAIGGQHLWADRFDRTVEDVFELQDEVNAKIVEALIGRLTIPTQRNRPKNFEAYDLCVRARLLTEESPQTAREAYVLLQRAVELEPSYAEALGLLAYNRWLAWTHFGEPEDPNRQMAVTFAQKAVDLDPNDAGCRYVLGTILAYERRWEESEAAFAKALELDPNHADTWAAMSDMSVLDGRVTDGLAQIEKALRLNPYPACWYLCHLGQAQYAARDYEAATATLRRKDTYRTNSRKFLAATLAQLGHLEEARREAELFLIAHPHFTIGHWLGSQPLRDASVRDHFADGFRKAGLPEM
jgi:adenylate cyclase